MLDPYIYRRSDPAFPPALVGTEVGPWEDVEAEEVKIPDADNLLVYTVGGAADRLEVVLVKKEERELSIDVFTTGGALEVEGPTILEEELTFEGIREWLEVGTLLRLDRIEPSFSLGIPTVV